jgi:hypothetical protein
MKNLKQIKSQTETDRERLNDEQMEGEEKQLKMGRLYYFIIVF